MTQIADVAVRSYLRDTSYWKTRVLTDSQGAVSIEFKQAAYYEGDSHYSLSITQPLKTLGSKTNGKYLPQAARASSAHIIDVDSGENPDDPGDDVVYDASFDQHPKEILAALHCRSGITEKVIYFSPDENGRTISNRKYKERETQALQVASDITEGFVPSEKAKDC